MNLSLDARQRAMLLEMGITTWAPAPAVVAAPAPPAMVASAAPQTVAASMAPISPPAPVRAATPAVQAPAPAASDAAALCVHAPARLYAVDGPAPTGLGDAWLVVTECPTPAQPLAGEVGKLLDNMLRAMRLHQHPRVFLAALERPRPGHAPGPSADLPPAQALAQAVAEVQPSMVLVLGHVAARAALGRTEPLGRLRAELHTLAGCPALVTYDPAFLLRSQDNKAAAWADLCRALALVRARQVP